MEDIYIGTPNAKQDEFLRCKKKYVAFGGARGGGKSWAVRCKAKLLAQRYPGIRMLLVRRTMPEIEVNHLETLRLELAGTAVYRAEERRFVFGNGSVLQFGYCACDRDADRYQGAEYDVIFFDEATQLKEQWMRKLAACVRGVVFFKESCMERIYPAAGGGHQIVTVPCSGVRKGAERTVAVADGVVYYLGNDGVYAFDGSMPVCVSRALGDKRYTGGVAGGESGRYWLSAVDAAGETELLVYDTQKRLWHRQDNTAAVAFARWNGEMTVLCSDGRLLDTSGTLGTAETGFSWSAESGDLGLYTPEHKYLSRLELRLKTAAGSTVKAYVCYDGDNVWEQVGGVSGEAGQTRGAVLQVRPRRCGHLRLKLAGDGPCRVYSAAAVYEKGSDGP